MRTDVGEPSLDFGNAVRILRCFCFRQQCGPLRMRLQYYLEQAFRSVWRLLRQLSDAPARRDLDVALFGRDISGDDAEKRGLTCTIAADQANPRAGWSGGAPSNRMRPAMRAVRLSMMSMPRLLADSAVRSNPLIASFN